MTRQTDGTIVTRTSLASSHRLEAGATREASATRKGCLVLLMLFMPAVAGAQEPKKTTKQQDQDKQLAERLLRKTTTGSDDGVMEAIIRLMNDAARRLEIEFDAGAETRAVQQRITQRLDEAIKIAASQRRLKRSKSPSGKSDKRSAEKGQASAAKKQATGSDASPADPSSSAAPGRVTGRSAVGALHETRRTWGHLPTRERDEILQGFQEGFLETYREWIERYYRVLQEMDE